MPKKPHPIYDASVYIPDVGKYWSDSNKDYTANYPGFIPGVIRSLNPLTGFGSALGNVYDAAQQGSLTGVALAGLSALPVLGKVGVAKGIYGDVYKPLVKGLVKDQASNTATGYASDQYNGLIIQ